MHLSLPRNFMVLFFLCASMVTYGPAAADPVSINFTGELSYEHGDCPLVSVGEPLEGVFRYDPQAATAQGRNDERSSYTFFGEGSISGAIHFPVSGVTFSLEHPASGSFTGRIALVSLYAYDAIHYQLTGQYSSPSTQFDCLPEDSWATHYLDLKDVSLPFELLDDLDLPASAQDFDPTQATYPDSGGSIRSNAWTLVYNIRSINGVELQEASVPVEAMSFGAVKALY